MNFICQTPIFEKEEKDKRKRKSVTTSDLFVSQVVSLCVSRSLNSQFWTPYEAEKNDMLIRMSTTPWHRVRFAGEDWCLHRALKASQSRITFFEPDMYYHMAGERKTRVYCFSMRKIHTKHSGVAFDLVTVLAM